MSLWTARAVGGIAISAAVFAPALTVQPLEPSTQSFVSDLPGSTEPAVEVERMTGADLDPCARWRVCGTDLGISFRSTDGDTCTIFGDTFDTELPGATIVPNGWRSPVMLCSDTPASADQPLIFTRAVGVDGDGMAPEIIPNGHNHGGEFTVIPNDGISFPETGDTIVSYMSINNWDNDGVAGWETNYAGLAWSHDGEHFQRIGPTWENNADNTDPFQMWSMQRDGDMVYIITTRAGRQEGPMMLMRVPWDKMLEKDAYECFNGHGWGGECQPILEGHFGEPSLRKLIDKDDPQKSIWVMSYLDLSDNPDTPEPDMPRIVTRTAPYIGAPWSEEKVQVDWDQQWSLYGGFIRWDSTPSHLMMAVSTWGEDPDGRMNYRVTEFEGSL